MPSYPNGSDKVIKESSGRSLGPQTRSVGPTVRSASLLMGRTHLSGMVMSLVGRDPRLSMYHKVLSDVYAQRPRGGHDEVMEPSTG
jgi:hypothetical protein